MGVTGNDATGGLTTGRWAPPFGFTGTIRRVRFDVAGQHVEDLAAQFRAVMARQ